MTVQVGDTVHEIVWDTVNGVSAEEYQLLDIGADQLTLRHTATWLGKHKSPGSLEIRSKPLRYLEYFSIPLDDRIHQSTEWLEWFCSEVTK